MPERNLIEVIDKRNEQTQRVMKALGGHDRSFAIHVLLSWMSVEDVDAMLEMIEK